MTFFSNVRRKLIAGAVIALASSLLAPMTAMAQIFAPPPATTEVQNGSFETPIVPINGFTNIPNSIAPFVWTRTGPIGAHVSVVNTEFVQNGVSFLSQDGSQWLDLTGQGSNSAAGISQLVQTTPGNNYILSYFIGNTTGGGIFGSTSTVNVSLGFIPLDETISAIERTDFSDTNSTVSPTSLNWKEFTHFFHATTGLISLSLTNGDGPLDNSNGLDHITLRATGAQSPPPTPAPEPASMAVIGMGMLGLGFIRRRRA